MRALQSGNGPKPAAAGAAPTDVEDVALTTAGVAEALKQALIEKCGSLEHAFVWLDFNSRGHLSRSQFDTGLRVLNLEGPVSNMKPTKIFSLIEKKTSSSVNLKEWRDFFGYSVDDEEDLADGSAMRGARVLRKVRNVANFLRTTKREGAADDSELDGGTGTLPEIDAILGLADDADPSFAGLEGNDALQHLGGVSRRKAGALVATDVHKAEAIQIEKDLEELNYKGVSALAYILTAKCKSVAKAFQWLDYNGKGSFTLMQWETACMVMHLDIEALTGMKARDIYQRMGGKKGRVSKKQFERFFACEMDEDSWKRIESLRSSFKTRSRKVLKGLLVFRRASASGSSKSQRRSSAQSSSAGFAQHGQSKSKDHRQAHGSSSARGSGTGAVATAALAAGWNQKAASSSSGGEGGAAGSSPALSADDGAPTGDLAAKAATKAAGGSVAAPGPKRPSGARRSGAPRRSRPSGSAGGDEPEGGVGGGRLAGAEAPSEETSGVSAEEARALDAFRKRVRQELFALGPDGGCEYEELSEAEGQILQEAAAELGFKLVLSELPRAVVFREGPVAWRMRQRLQAVRPGERVSFSGSGPQLQFVRHVAEALGLCLEPSSVGEGIKSLDVFNIGGSLEEFLEGAKQRLQGMQHGETLKFPSGLSSERLQALRGLAAKLGYFGVLVGQDQAGEGGQLCIGHLSHLEGELRDKLRAIVPGESLEIANLCGGSFAKRDPLTHELLLKVVAEEGLLVQDFIISRFHNDATAAESSSGEDDEDEEEEMQGVLDFNTVLDEATVKERVAELFNRFATGKQGRTNIFLRKPDLTQFISDALAAEGRKMSKQVAEWIEAEYEETLELQVDMGSKYHYGIVLEFFQVFLCKAADALDRSLVGLLTDMLQWFQRPEKRKRKARGSTASAA